MAEAQKDNRLFKNFFSLSLLQLANNVLPIISVPVIVRVIGPDKFGVINFASVIISYFIMFVNFSFDLTATRAIAINRENEDNRSSVFNQVLIAKLILLLFSIIVFTILLFSLPQLASEKKVALFSFLIVFSFVLTPNWLYQGMQELHNIAVFNFITKLLFTFLVLFVVRNKEDYFWQPFIISAAHVLVGIIAFAWAIRRYRIRLALVPLRSVLKHLWNERVMFLSFVSINVYQYASTLVLGLVRTPEDVAFFSSSWRMVIIMHTIVTIPLGMALFPFIGESFGLSREKGIERVKITAPFVFYTTLVMGIAVCVLAPFIITTFYGEAFRPAINVLRIICFTPVFMGISNLMGVQTMVNLKMDRPYTVIIITGGVIGIGLNLLLASNYSYIGAAWAWLATEAAIGIIMWYYLGRKNIQVINGGYFRFGYLYETVQPMIINLKQKFNKPKS